jgi:hypothetical protein
MRNAPVAARRARVSFARLALLLAAATLALPTPARGNMANPVRAGARVGEPAAGLEHLFVRGERLSVDLRPLAGGGEARVEAVYDLRNDGAARTVSLVFVADALVERGSGVWMDGRPVAATPSETTDLPPSWRPPAATPGLDGREPLGYAVADRAGELAFSLTFTPGEHQVRVRYRARPTAHSAGSPAVFWQLAYVLAPARSWAGYGGLAVRIQLPAGWHAAVTPAMRRQGDALVGSWSRLPADAIAITAQAPVGSGAGQWTVLVVVALAALALCAWLARLLGGALARRDRSTAWALGPAAGLALAWAIVTGIAIAALPSGIAGGLGPQKAWGYGYGTGIVGLFAIPFLFLLALLALQAAAWLGGRAARRRTPSTEPEHEAVSRP